MRQIVITLDAPGASQAIPMDQYISPFNVGFGCATTGAVTFTVQHSFDNPFAADYDPTAATWYNHPDVTGAVADADGNYAFPVSAIRLVLAGGSTGSVTMTINQAGIGS